MSPRGPGWCSLQHAKDYELFFRRMVHMGEGR